MGVPNPPPCPPIPPITPQRALQVLSAALEDPPPSLTPHCRPIAELCRGGLQPGTPPHSTAYALKALGGLAAALGGTQTVSDPKIGLSDPKNGMGGGGGIGEGEVGGSCPLPPLKIVGVGGAEMRA